MSEMFDLCIYSYPMVVFCIYSYHVVVFLYLFMPYMILKKKKLRDIKKRILNKNKDK